MDTPVKPMKESLTQLSELMMPSHVNNVGSVFGGVILQLMDKAAFVAAVRHAGVPCVTASFDRVDFVSPIRVGELVTLKALVRFAGTSSMEVGVTVMAEDFLSGQTREAFRGRCTMVALGPDGIPTRVPRVQPETEEEKALFAAAEKRYRERRRR